MDSDDFQGLPFSGKSKKSRDSGQNFDAKNVGNSGQKFLENPMPKVMEFHQKSMEICFWAAPSISLPLATFSCHEARCRGPMPRGNGHEAARGTWQAARGTWQVARGPWQVARSLR